MKERKKKRMKHKEVGQLSKLVCWSIVDCLLVDWSAPLSVNQTKFSTHRPEMYDQSIFHYDLLAINASFSHLTGPACLPPAGKDYRGTQNCILSGWGYYNLNQQSTLTDTNLLQKVT